MLARCLSLAVLLWGVAAAPSQAQPRPQPGPATPDLHRHETRTERPPPPAPLIGEPAEDAAPEQAPAVRWDVLLDTVWGTVLDWQRQLSAMMPPAAAWAVLAAPLWLLVLLLLVRRWRNRPRRRPRAGARSTPARSVRSSKAEEPAPATAPAMVQPERPAPVELTPARRVLEGLGRAVGVHDRLLGLGLVDDTVQELVAAARSQLDRALWAAAIAEARDDRLQPCCEHWLKRVAVARIERWLASHPAVVDSGLSVQIPAVLEVEAVENLALTQPDGLGATLTAEHKALLEQGRQALAVVFADAANPYQLLAVAAARKLPALLGGGPSVALFEVPACYAVAVLLRGLVAVGPKGQTGWEAPDLDELRQALAEHRAVSSAPVPAEGSAVHALAALDGGNLPGVGPLLASVAGAAYSTSSVVMMISKQAGEIEALAAAPLVRLGRQVMRALEEPEAGDGELIIGNAAALLGIDLLEQHERQVALQVRAFERGALRRPLWPDARADDPERPDAALLGLHQQRVRQALEQARAAHQRWREIFRSLSYAGKTGENEALANRRVGYAVVALGMPLLRGTSTEMLSSAREALAAVEPDIEYVSTE